MSPNQSQETTLSTKSARKEHSALLTAELEVWRREERAKLAKHAAVAKAFDDML